MPDNPKGPEQQDLLATAGQADTGAAPEQDKPLTRKDLEEFLGKVTGEIQGVKKEYQGLRSVTDKKFNALQQRIQSAAQAVPDRDDAGYQQDGQIDWGTEKDRRLARMLMKQDYPGFDYSKIEPLLNDPEASGRHIRFEQDGRTLDWASIYESAWGAVEAEEARELRRQADEKRQQESLQRDEAKRRAVISGADASYPEGSPIPRTREEARKLTDAELRASMEAQFDIPAGQEPSFFKDVQRK